MLKTNHTPFLFILFVLSLSLSLCGGLKDFYPKKLLPSQASQLTTGNLGGRYKPPEEADGAEFRENFEINAS